MRITHDENAEDKCPHCNCGIEVEYEGPIEENALCPNLYCKKPIWVIQYVTTVLMRA